MYVYTCVYVFHLHVLLLLALSAALSPPLSPPQALQSFSLSLAQPAFLSGSRCKQGWSHAEPCWSSASLLSKLLFLLRAAERHQRSSVVEGSACFLILTRASNNIRPNRFNIGPPRKHHSPTIGRLSRRACPMALGSGGLLAGCGPQRLSSVEITVWEKQMRVSSWGV